MPPSHQDRNFVLLAQTFVTISRFMTVVADVGRLKTVLWIEKTLRAVYPLAAKPMSR